MKGRLASRWQAEYHYFKHLQALQSIGKKHSDFFALSFTQSPKAKGNANSRVQKLRANQIHTNNMFLAQKLLTTALRKPTFRLDDLSLTPRSYRQRPTQDWRHRTQRRTLPSKSLTSPDAPRALETFSSLQ